MREPYAEGLATHGGPESCGRAREDAPEAFDRGTYRPGIEPRNLPGYRGPKPWTWRKATPTTANARRAVGGPGEVEDPEHVRKHLAREPGDPVTALERMVLLGRGGKSEDAIRR